MKGVLFVAVAVAVVIFIAERYRKEFVPLEDTFENGRPWPDSENTEEDLDDILGRVLGDCFEAYCEDCEDVLAVGTGPYQSQVANVAYTHGEVFDHETRVRSWAE